MLPFADSHIFVITGLPFRVILAEEPGSPERISEARFHGTFPWALYQFFAWLFTGGVYCLLEKTGSASS